MEEPSPAYKPLRTNDLSGRTKSLAEGVPSWSSARCAGKPASHQSDTRCYMMRRGRMSRMIAAPGMANTAACSDPPVFRDAPDKSGQDRAECATSSRDSGSGDFATRHYRRLLRARGVRRPFGPNIRRDLVPAWLLPVSNAARLGRSLHLLLLATSTTHGAGLRGPRTLQARRRHRPQPAALLRRLPSWRAVSRSHRWGRALAQETTTGRTA